MNNPRNHSKRERQRDQSEGEGHPQIVGKAMAAQISKRHVLNPRLSEKPFEHRNRQRRDDHSRDRD